MAHVRGMRAINQFISAIFFKFRFSKRGAGWLATKSNPIKSSPANGSYLNRLSFANDITVVAPPNEWPTIATLFKSNLPFKEKPVQLVTGIGDSNI